MFGVKTYLFSESSQTSLDPNGQITSELLVKEIAWNQAGKGNRASLSLVERSNDIVKKKQKNTSVTCARLGEKARYWLRALLTHVIKCGCMMYARSPDL